MFLAHLSKTYSRGAFRVVERPSCVVNNFFKHLLLNRWANFDQTWQELSWEVLFKNRTSLKMIHVESKTRSVGQILEKPCVCYRGHIFSVMIMKLVNDVCLNEISDEF